jgi:hypothetical protein
VIHGACNELPTLAQIEKLITTCQATGSVSAAKVILAIIKFDIQSGAQKKPYWTRNAIDPSLIRTA